MMFEEYPDRDMMMIDLASHLAGELKAALLTHDRASFAVPGGTTPGPVFDALCAADLDWARVDVLLTDERRVPSDHERSNQRLLRERLLVGRATSASYVSIVPEADDPLPDLAAHLPLSIVLLGMGADMHTASLFPGSPDLRAALDPHAPPLMYVDAPDGLEPRVTLTGPVLSGAMGLHVLIAGSEKREALEKAQGLSATDAPIKTVLGAATVHWAP